MASCVLSAVIHGLHVQKAFVETDIAFGLKRFHIVGLPGRAVREACNRVESAIKNSGLEFPRFRIVVNLAPAHIAKSGPMYDVPMAIGILAAQGLLQTEACADHLFVGELGLNGTVRPVRGILPIARFAQEQGIRVLVVPQENIGEAACLNDLSVLGISTLKALVGHLGGVQNIAYAPHSEFRPETIPSTYDMAHIKGQSHAKRALEIAAAGGHNVFMSGPPGAGKTLLAKTLPSILPHLTLEESLEVTSIHSVAGVSPCGLITQRPFRSPHHTASTISLIGGGSDLRPGDVSLAHRGVLFLDEIPEFPRHVTEALRQPLEDGAITVSRVAGTVRYPARFLLIGAMNPCPCGFAGDPVRACVCAPNLVAQYQKRLSGPFLDRIDMFLHIPRVETADLVSTSQSEPSAHVRARVQHARDRQTSRYASTAHVCNADVPARYMERHGWLCSETRDIMRTAIAKFQLSARSYMRTIRLARTIADLADNDLIGAAHVAEALQFRSPLQE